MIKSKKLRGGNELSEYYNIAGLTVKMECSGRTKLRAIPYQCSPVSNIDIEIPTQRIRKTCQIWKEQFFPNDSDEIIEYTATGSLFGLYLLQHSGLILHASAIVVNNKAYLFTAHSGTGKSTHTTLWLNHFGDKAFILNDDKPAIRYIDGKWYAYGTPWSGKNDINRNCRAELAGIAVLERAEENSIERYDGVDAIFAILSQVNRTKEPEHRIKMMELLDNLITQVPIWKLKCNMDPDAALVSYQAMSAHEKEI